MARKISVFTLSALILILCNTACEKGEKKILNIISLEGNSTTEYNKDYIPENAIFIPATLWECEATMYRTLIQLSLQPSAGLIFEIFQTGNTEQIPVGTFSLSSPCAAGFTVAFYPNSDNKATGICFSAGSLTIEKEGDKYDIEMNLTIGSECGGGTMIGNFNGKLSESQN
jgi:hypothetical protein